MAHLQDFCNIISHLRREKGWSQTAFAEKLCISPQAISKWECGVGLPDITLFPVIAETLGVPVGVLFGEKIEGNLQTAKEEKLQMKMAKTEQTIANGSADECAATVLQREYDPCRQIDATVGNVCRLLFYDGARDRALIQAVGDPTFIKYFSVEIEDGRLLIEVKNPSGSVEKWVPYNRDGLRGENIVRVFTGLAETDINVTNYLDLCCRALAGDEENVYEVNVTPLKRQRA